MRLKLHVCSNYLDDYKTVLKNEGFDDVVVVPFPCYCTNRELEKKPYLLFDEEDQFTDNIIICGNYCPILKYVGNGKKMHHINTMNYCFNHLVNDKLIEYILERGGYIVTNGWLKSWQMHLEKEGFNQELAQLYYKEFCNELVLLDTNIDKESETRLKALSVYLDIPYRILNIGLENLSVYIRSLVFEWRLKCKHNEVHNSINEIRKQTAEYSAVLKIIEQIAVYTKKRDIVEKLKEIFVALFGAGYIRYVDMLGNSEYIETHYKTLMEDANAVYAIGSDNKQLVLKFQHGDELYGVLEAGDFLFPEYLKNYVNFALSIVRVCALGFSNASQYEQLEKSRDEITYTSSHDSLTGLYNRNFYNKYLKEHVMSIGTGILVADVDGLKIVNDTLGHLSGDELISLAAKALKESFRDTDIIARIGGDEFLVIVFESNEAILKEAKARIQHVIGRLNSEIADKPYSLSISVGASLKLAEGIGWESVIHEADQQMYEEKAFKRKK